MSASTEIRYDRQRIRRQQAGRLDAGFRAALRRGCHPVLLVAVVGTVVAALGNHWNLGVVNLLFLTWTVGYLTAMERLIPYARGWHPTRREWGWYGAWFLLTMVGGAVAQLPVMAIVGAVAVPEPTLPLWAEIPLAALLGSLVSYLVHRWGHTNRYLWRLHGIHHVPEKVNVANNGVNHVADVVLAQGAVQLALAVVGFSEPAVFAVGIFIIAQGYFVHANVDVRIGWLNHVFASPEQHRLHHSTDLAEAGHFASDLSMWDRVFGTFTWYPGRTPVAIGLQDPTSFPATGSLLASLLHPVRRRPGAGS
mgnify:CR=1 FL=1